MVEAPKPSFLYAATKRRSYNSFPQLRITVLVQPTERIDFY